MYNFNQNRAKKRKISVFEAFLPIFQFSGAEKVLYFSLPSYRKNPVFIVLLAHFREMGKCARIAQNQENKAELGWGAKFRKEIELSVQKTKNGILPTVNSALRTDPRLHF